MATNENEAEILRIIRSMREGVALLVDNVADQVPGRLKSGISAPAQITKPEPENEEAPGRPTAAAETSEEFASVQVELAEITEQRDKAQNDRDGLIAELAQHKAQIEEVKQEIVAAKAEAGNAADLKRETEVEVTRLKRDADSARDELKQLSERHGELEAELTHAHALISEAEPVRRSKESVERSLAELEERRAEFEGYRQVGESALLLLERFWPEWLRAGALAEWKARIEAGAFDAASPPSFGLLFAAVHTYNAALRDSDAKTLHDSLRDVGRRLYAWLRDLGQSESDSAKLAEQWAQAINGDCVGRGEIEVPIPGNAANNQWMIFQPRGGSSPDVASVRSWCVRDAQKRPVHRTEVTV